MSKVSNAQNGGKQLFRTRVILMRIQVESLTGPLHWDDYKVIDSLSLYTIPGKSLVGVTFVVNKEPYHKCPANENFAADK